MQHTKDNVLSMLINGLRTYLAYSPIKKGRYRLTSVLYRMAKRLSRQVLLTVTASDGRKFRIDVRDPQYHMGLLDRRLFEPEETQVVMQSVKPGQIVIDAGANFGWYTTLLSRLVGPTGSVHAFEAMPSTARILKENCEINHCENVALNQCALADRRGTTVIYDQPGRASGDASLFAIDRNRANSYSCEMQTLDDYFSKTGLSRCDFIKCDVEGAELLFLKGARTVLRQYKPIVLIEINPAVLQRSGTNGVEVLKELRRDADYSFQVVGRQNEYIEPRDCETLSTYINVLCHPL